jgi:hypothetical protein
MQLLRNVFILPVIVIMLLTACAATQVNRVWKEPAYTARPKKILVVGVARVPENRRALEDGFVEQLKARGTRAIASYTLLPEYKSNDQETISRIVKEQGADAVLITRVVGKASRDFIVPGKFYQPPPNYGTWQNYFGYGLDIEYIQPVVTPSRNSIIETNLYDTENDRLVWYVASETGGSGSSHSIIESYIRIMMQTLSADGLVGP